MCSSDLLAAAEIDFVEVGGESSPAASGGKVESRFKVEKGGK